MKNKIYIGISLAILAIGGYFLYQTKFWKEKKIEFSKEEAISYIVQQGKHQNGNFISTFDEPFLKAWAIAISENKTSFPYNGKLYNTQGGTSVKN